MLSLIIDSDHLTGIQRQIANQIAVLIREGLLAPGELLPGEVSLADYYRISRAVVREAYRILKEKKLIETLGSRGTFVVENPHKNTFSEYMRIQVPASLKEKIDVIALYQQMNPNELIERELTDKIERLIKNSFLEHQSNKRTKSPPAANQSSVNEF